MGAEIVSNPNAHFRQLTDGKYADPFICPDCGKERIIFRWKRVAGRIVSTYCEHCQRSVKVVAGTEEPKS